MKPLAITLGDPSGIGPEVVFKALADLAVPVWLFGSKRWSEGAPDVERFIDVGGEGDLEYGRIDARYGQVALDSVHAAIDAVERGDCSALVTAPIHKQATALAGSPYPGHTELLAARAGLSRYAHDYAMYFDSPRIRTVLLSVHVPLREAIASIRAEDIAALAALTSREFAKLYGREPHIAVAAVNPHAGEGGRFGDEEKEIARGVALAASPQVTGPHPPDTVFLGGYDVVMAMYHDQGLIPVKTMDFHHSVNVTLGLPWLRVSVDHGTAFDIAGRGAADPGPMRYAIEWAADGAQRLEENRAGRQ